LYNEIQTRANATYDATKAEFLAQYDLVNSYMVSNPDYHPAGFKFTMS